MLWLVSGIGFALGIAILYIFDRIFQTQIIRSIILKVERGHLRNIILCFHQFLTCCSKTVYVDSETGEEVNTTWRNETERLGSLLNQNRATENASTANNLNRTTDTIVTMQSVANSGQSTPLI